GRALAQFGEQARVLDGDDGLGSEVRDQLDLLVGERPHLLAVNVDRSNQLVILEHRHTKKRASAGGFDKRNHGWIAPDISFLRRKVGNMDDLLGSRDDGKRSVGIVAYRKQGVPRPSLSETQGSIMQRPDTECIAVIEKQIAK